MCHSWSNSAQTMSGRCLVLWLVAFAFLGLNQNTSAQIPLTPANKARTSVGSNPSTTQRTIVGSNPSTTTASPTTGNIAGSITQTAVPRMRGTTIAQRKAAAAHVAARRAAARVTAHGRLNLRSNAIVGLPGAGSGVMPDPGTLYFSGMYANYANSPLPNPNDTLNCSAPNYCGIRKFIDSLPLPNTVNDLGQMLPVAVPDTITFPGSDYYEISLLESHTLKLHKDLPATQLRSYVQTNFGTDGSGLNTVTPGPANYLGPLIIATSNRPVRVKFINALPTGASGDLFLPVDRTLMGAGLGLANGSAAYLDNRATVHMHGGNTPWISDGTPHQWTVPAGDSSTTYPRGASVQFVPDMFFLNGTVIPQCSATVTTNCSGPNNAATLPPGATNDPGPGALTFYYTNQQSARLMFYHDHAYGTTRLNVYAGEAAGYLLQDQYEMDLVNGTNLTKINPLGLKAIPATEIPLVIQDKTFVPPNPATTTVYSVPLLELGSGYTNPSVSFTGGCAVEPVGTVNFGTTTDPFGQYIYGAVLGINLTSYGSGCTSGPSVTISDPTGTGAVAFAYVATLSQQDPTWDTAKWGGQGNLWYPHVYMPNQWPNNPDGSGVNPMGRWDYASWFWPAFTNQYQTRGEIACVNPVDGTADVCPGTPTPMNPAPANDLSGATHLGVGSVASLTPEAFMDTPMVNGTVYPTLTVDPKPYRFRILSVGNDRSLNLSLFLACTPVGNNSNGYTPNANSTCPAPTVAGIAPLTEVGMVPATPNSTPNYPAWWPTDGRDGGVPDPAAMGPSWVVIGNEGGFLPAPAVIPPAPVNYEYNRRSVTVTNTSSVSLNLMPAERADVIVDFSKYAGKTLILYNDAPAPYPAFDSRYDYYTGDPDQSGFGGAPTTLAGFGPNTRTVMQIKVNSGTATAFDSTALQALLPAAFKASQPVPIVPEPVYSAIYGNGTKFGVNYPVLGANSMTFTPIGATKPLTMTFGQKAIQELFELDYGRMNATLGTEIQLTTYNNQTTIPLGYVDPFTEDIYDSANVSAQPVGVTGDGSQIWEVIHNGVDSHAIHFHLYNVQLIDRVGWDGTLRAPLPYEMGWKDTVRMNPLEIDFVALRPMSQQLPFPVPDSVRLLDVTRPAGFDPAMSTFGPTNAAFSQMNSVVAMGWEYVWHCHILGHEENDMMREQTFQVPPQSPVNLAVFALPIGNRLAFTDMALSETGFTVQRADDAQFTVNPVTFTINGAQPGWNTTLAYTDTTATPGPTRYYRVQAFKPDADYWNASLGTGPLPELASGWSNTALPQVAPYLTVNPATLTFGTQAYQTAGAALTTTLSNTGSATGIVYAISISGPNASDFSYTTTCPLNTAPNVAVGANCSIAVQFKPSYPGTRTATLAITSNDAVNPTLSVPLRGTGAPVALSITASSATINWGTGVLTITPIVVGLLPGDTVASLSGLTCSTTYKATSNAGTYPTSCSGAANPAYTVSYVSGSLIVKQVAAAILTPTPGITFTGTTATFTWNTGGAATVYSLNLGTAGAGSLNVYNSGFFSGTSANVTGLPTTAGTIYARLFSRVNGVYVYNDYTYTATGASAPATMISPVPGSVLPGSNATFTWTTGNGATQYSLNLGTIGVGASNLYNSGWVTSTSVNVTGLPTGGKTIYVRLYSIVNGVTQYVDYTLKSM